MPRQQARASNLVEDGGRRGKEGARAGAFEKRSHIGHCLFRRSGSRVTPATMSIIGNTEGPPHR